MATTAHTQLDRHRIAELTAREEKRLNAETRARAACSSAPEGAVRRRRLLVPAARSLADLPREGRRRVRVGRRRQRDDRLPQRLRLDGAGARAIPPSPRP